MNIYFGDIHNHCNISYGHGDLKSALKNAALQLDFVSITGHALWPDMPEEESRLKEVVDYHKEGFSRLKENWPGYIKEMEKANREGEFVTFPSYEIHSCEEGDHVVYSTAEIESIPEIESMDEIRKKLKEEIARGINTFFIPHHIGYKQGFRGIKWETFDEELSPFVEIISMHGCAESDDTPALPYLHTMGPRDRNNTMAGGLTQGHFFGISGSTDHHSAHPGSYGYGRMAIVAEDLTRDSLFDAMRSRRVYALTGDRIDLDISLNGHLMGSRVPSCDRRAFHMDIRGGDALDHVEIVKNGKLIKRFDFIEREETWPGSAKLKGKVFVEVGWGEKGKQQNWDFELKVDKGQLLEIEPRFHGVDVVDPLDKHERDFQFTDWSKTGDSSLRCSTATYGNPTSQTSATEGFSLEIEGGPESEVRFTNGDFHFSEKLGDLIKGSRTAYLGGFLTGAVRFSRFVPEGEYARSIDWVDEDATAEGDVYYVRVCQRNNQWAWSAPFKIGRTE